MPKASKADPFNVWGLPPQALSKGMTPRQLTILRRYVEVVASKSYRIAYDNGATHGLTTVAEVAHHELKKIIGVRSR